jgi:hypothetical protein
MAFYEKFEKMMLEIYNIGYEINEIIYERHIKRDDYPDNEALYDEYLGNDALCEEYHNICESYELGFRRLKNLEILDRREIRVLEKLRK